MEAPPKERQLRPRNGIAMLEAGDGFCYLSTICYFNLATYTGCVRPKGGARAGAYLCLLWKRFPKYGIKEGDEFYNSYFESREADSYTRRVERGACPRSLIASRTAHARGARHAQDARVCA
jgi:hypothetical protein